MNNTSKSRTSNSVRNACFGFASQFTRIFLQFAVRTAFIKVLGEVYLGINGLFTNILMVLSLAELGVGNAVIFNMYKPIANGDNEQIKTLVQFYGKCYRVIACVVACVGLMLVPFLRYIIKYDGVIQHIELIYILYLAQTVSSYLICYKTSIVSANQQGYIMSSISIKAEIIISLLEIFVITVFKNFYLYLVISILYVIVVNIIKSRKAIKMYPEILKSKDIIPIEKDKRKSIFKDIRALMLYRIGGVISNGTDNIIISSFVGVVSVGLYSNYYMIMSAVRGILISFINALTASVGNLNALDNKKRSEQIYLLINFVSFYLFGFISVGFYFCLTPFIRIWAGNNFVMSNYTVIAIVINFYLYGMNNVSIMYRNTLGLFIVGKYRPLIGAILNIVFSVLFAKPYGVAGILFATALSNILTTVWFDPIMIAKRGFDSSARGYFIRYIAYILFIVCCCAVLQYTFSRFVLTGVIGIVIRVVVCTLVFHILFLAAFCKTSEFKELTNILRKYIQKRGK